MVERQQNVGPTKSAVMSDCGLYRYELRRQWRSGSSFICFVGLNPSTADAINDDPTIRRCVQFAKDWKADGLIMVNLFAYRSTKPAGMHAAAKQNMNIVGPENMDFVNKAIQQSFMAIAAWGNLGDCCDANELIATGKLKHLGLNKNGTPKHPLYIKSDTKPERFSDESQTNISTP